MTEKEFRQWLSAIAMWSAEDTGQSEVIKSGIRFYEMTGDVENMPIPAREFVLLTLAVLAERTGHDELIECVRDVLGRYLRDVRDGQ